jgi:hypothetical protein
MVDETCASTQTVGWAGGQRPAMPGHHTPHLIQVVAGPHGMSLSIHVAAVIRRISHKGEAENVLGAVDFAVCHRRRLVAVFTTVGTIT